MFCPNCGTPNNDTNYACVKCGTILKTPQQQSPYAQPQQSPYAQPQQSPYAQPQQRTYAQPQQSPYAQPQQPRYAQPIRQQSPYAQPQQQVYRQPQQSPYAQPQQPRYAQPIRQQSPYAQPQQQAYRQAQQPGPIPGAPASNGFAGFWYKFMTAAGFFLTAAGFIMMGIANFIGWQYGAASAYGYSIKYVDVVKNYYGGLRAADIISGILFILLGLLSIYAWTLFKGYKVKAPQITSLIYGGSAALLFVYSVLVFNVFLTDGATFSAATEVYPIVFPIIMIVAMAAVCVLNMNYFKTEKLRYVNR